ERLTPLQRQAVVLVHGCGYPYREVAQLLEIAPSTVQTHVERGLEKLRAALGVMSDV
ncbi:MAG: RNA polymerase sigma factor, partial [Acidimicrobiia bacterium]